jgi:type IV secretion system protein VirD4
VEVLGVRGSADAGERGGIISLNSFLYTLAVFFDKLSARFSQEEKLFKSRYARLWELAKMSIHKADVSKRVLGIFLAFGLFNQVLCTKPTKVQKELGNILLIGKTRCGKGLNIETNLLTWPYPTIVNDIKGELWRRTAGWRKNAMKFDPRGYGHKFDPLERLTSDFDLRSAATTLLYRPNEGKNAIFTERAITMLTQIFHAARLAGPDLKLRPLPFTYEILNKGLEGVVTILEIISEKYNYHPNLATKFLDKTYDNAKFDSNFLNDCYTTLTTRMNNILTKESVRCFTGSDFSGKDIITSGANPISVYLCWPEKHLLFLSPLIELVWNSLLDDMIDYYDSVQGKGCVPVTAFLDEIFRTGMKKLPEYTTTVCGRNISLFVSAQSKSQLDAAYGRFNADKLKGQFDTAIIHRPAPLDYETMLFIEQILGYQSGFAHSRNEHEGGTSTGENEQRVPLMSASETEFLGETEVIVKRSGIRPTIAQRLDWRLIPELAQRANMELPTLPKLSALENVQSFYGNEYRRSFGGFLPFYERSSPADMGVNSVAARP